MNLTISDIPVPEPETLAPAIDDSVTPKELGAVNIDCPGIEENDKSASVLQSSPLAALLLTPVDARGLALAVLATLAIILTLQWAQNFWCLFCLAY